ncbi:MAG: hypothetical protein Fur0041_21900 [Bacteroidia bacterium]
MNTPVSELFRQSMIPAAILTALVIVINLVLYLTDLIYGFGPLILFPFYLTGIILLMRNWKKNQMNNTVTFKEAFYFGLGMIMAYSAFIFIFDMIFYNFIAPDFYDGVVNYWTEFYQNIGVPEKQMEEMLEQFEKGRTSNAMMAVNALPSRLIFGTIIVLIVAAIIKKKNTPEESLPSNPA